MKRSKVDGRREGGPEEDGCHKLEDTCAQRRRLEDGHEGGQGPTRTVESCSRVETCNTQVCRVTTTPLFTICVT